MTNELKKRLITSVFLMTLLALIFMYNYILIITLIIILTLSWVEFSGLISKIFIKKTSSTKLLKLLVKILILIYLVFFSYFLYLGIIQPDYKLNIFYLFSICIFSDIGGLIFGKIFKGKKLTKISPNKTISGSIGSFVLSLFLVPIFYFVFLQTNDYYSMILIAIIVSFSCQLGDLFISYLKRKANVKDTGDLLPGHGGILDRIDGILLAIPVGMLFLRL